MKLRINSLALLVGAIFASSSTVNAASCCGGGASSSLIMPKSAKAMVDISLAAEHYDGFWNKQGDYVPDPPGSRLSQYRLNLGYGKRLASRWQGSISMPYVWNDNQYSGLQSSSRGLGDMSLGLWYETFDEVTCVWKVKTLQDLKPAVYLGTSLTVPTGVSPYDDVANNFDITGRGFYRLDANLLVEKTIYPFSASFQFSYGQYLQRSVNREYGKYVEPYRKQLGDRLSMSASLGYTQFLESMSTITYTSSYSYLQEDEGEINGVTDLTSGLEKRAYAASIAYATMDSDWVFKASWSPAKNRSGWGENFPVTEVVTLGVSHVLR